MHTIMDDTLVRPSQLKVENVFTLERLERSDLDLDTEVHTDLDPGESPDWSVEVSLVEKPECLLAKHLDKHLALCSDTRTVRMLIGELLEESEGDAGMGQVLDKMTGTGGSYGLADLSGLVRPLRRSPTGGLKN